MKLYTAMQKRRTECYLVLHTLHLPPNVDNSILADAVLVNNEKKSVLKIICRCIKEHIPAA